MEATKLDHPPGFLSEAMIGAPIIKPRALAAHSPLSRGAPRERYADCDLRLANGVWSVIIIIIDNRGF